MLFPEKKVIFVKEVRNGVSEKSKKPWKIVKVADETFENLEFMLDVENTAQDLKPLSEYIMLMDLTNRGTGLNISACLVEVPAAQIKAS